jgi:hypothetical protein
METKADCRTIFDLDSTELALLEYYANNSTGKAGSMARGILEYASNGHFCHCPGSQPTWFKQSKPHSKTFADRGIKVTVKPNPAGNYIIAAYRITAGKTACLLLNDGTGKEVESFIIKPETNQRVIPLTKYANGNYIISLVIDNHVLDSAKLTISH